MPKIIYSLKVGNIFEFLKVIWFVFKQIALYHDTIQNLKGNNNPRIIYTIKGLQLIRMYLNRIIIIVWEYWHGIKMLLVSCSYYFFLHLFYHEWVFLYLFLSLILNQCDIKYYNILQNSLLNLNNSKTFFFILIFRKFEI